MKSIFILLVGLAFTVNVFASDVSDVKIIRMMVDTAHGDKLFIKINKLPSNAPDCSINGTWQYVMPLTSELTKNTFMSMLLSAYMGDKTLRLQGTDDCKVFGSVETLKRVEFLN